MNQYYVYLYLDQRKSGTWEFSGITMQYQPFYVGKGCNNRDVSHFWKSNLVQKNMKNSKIKAIMNDIGELPLHFRIIENLSEDNAFETEISFIKKFGRIDTGTGILCNLNDGGKGQFDCAKSIKEKIGRKKEVFQFTLNGKFLKKWNSLKEVKEGLNLNISNISTAVKRKGTCYGYIWRYSYENITPQIRYQMPIKYNNIKQISLDSNEIIGSFVDALDAEIQLKLTKGARNKILACLNEKQKSAYGFKWKI